MSKKQDGRDIATNEMGSGVACGTSRDRGGSGDSYMAKKHEKFDELSLEVTELKSEVRIVKATLTDFCKRLDTEVSIVKKTLTEFCKRLDTLEKKSEEELPCESKRHKSAAQKSGLFGMFFTGNTDEEQSHHVKHSNEFYRSRVESAELELCKLRDELKREKDRADKAEQDLRKAEKQQKKSKQLVRDMRDRWRGNKLHTQFSHGQVEKNFGDLFVYEAHSLADDLHVSAGMSKARAHQVVCILFHEIFERCKSLLFKTMLEDLFVPKTKEGEDNERKKELEQIYACLLSTCENKLPEVLDQMKSEKEMFHVVKLVFDEPEETMRAEKMKDFIIKAIELAMNMLTLLPPSFIGKMETTMSFNDSLHQQNPDLWNTSKSKACAVYTSPMFYSTHDQSKPTMRAMVGNDYTL